MAQFPQSNSSLKPQYWDKFLGDSMYSQSVANAMLTKAMNTSVSIVSKALQDALNKLFGAGLQVDGIVGTKTLTALNTYTAMVNPNAPQNEQNIITHISVYNASLILSTTTTTKPSTTNTTTPTTTVPVIAPATTNKSINWGKVILYVSLAVGGSALLYMATKKSNPKQALQGVKVSKKKSTTKKRQKK